MKVFFTVLKILAALAVIAGIIYIAVKYGDKIVAWVKKKLKLDCLCDKDCCCDNDCCCEDDFCAEEIEAEAPVQAEENDFEG